MPRGKRLTFDNAIFHIINRGNARQDIITQDIKPLAISGRIDLLFQEGGVLGSEKFKKDVIAIMEKFGISVKPKTQGRPARG